MWWAHLRMRVNYICCMALVNTTFDRATEFIGGKEMGLGSKSIINYIYNVA